MSKVIVDVEIEELDFADICNSGETPSKLMAKLAEDWLRTLRNKLIKENYKWTKTIFFDFMNWLKMSSDYPDVFWFITTYHGLETHRPKAKEIFSYGFRYYKKLSDCQRELRVVKMRTTVILRNSTRWPKDPIFTNPYGKGLDRIHPMNSEIFHWLNQWFATATSPRAIPEHELDPQPDCPCGWCEEARPDLVALDHMDHGGPETVSIMIAPGHSISVPKRCPNCGTLIDDPEGCWSCDFEFEPRSVDD